MRVRVRVLPCLEQLLRLVEQCLDVVQSVSGIGTRQKKPRGAGRPSRRQRRGVRSYPLFPGIGNVPVGLEEGADVEGLAAPEVPVDSPVERQLQRAAVERAAGERVRSAGRADRAERRAAGGGAHRAACLVDMAGSLCRFRRGRRGSSGREGLLAVRIAMTRGWLANGGPAGVCNWELASGRAGPTSSTRLDGRTRAEGQTAGESVSSSVVAVGREGARGEYLRCGAGKVQSIDRASDPRRSEALARFPELGLACLVAASGHSRRVHLRPVRRLSASLPSEDIRERHIVVP